MRALALSGALILVAACGPRPPLSPRAAAQGPPPQAEGVRVCPRVERAARMWSGFLVDVPSEAMVQALDVVVPIQVALGETFCAEELAGCRPKALLAIDLSDESAVEAHVRVQLARGVEARGSAPEQKEETLELPLIMRRARDVQHASSAPGGDAWRADAQSLSHYLELCRTASKHVATTKAAPE